MPVALDITGQRFNMLTALRRVSSTVGTAMRPHRKWLCRCDCGENTIVSASKLRTGHTQSCGCHGAHKLAVSKFRRPPEVRNAWLAYSTCKRAALKRGYEFALTFEQFMAIVKLDCVYCGAKPSNVYRVQKNSNPPFTYSGIDREDNGIGYIFGNCVPCCSKCNWMKKAYASPVFIAHCVQVTFNQFKRLNDGKAGLLLMKSPDGWGVSLSQSDRRAVRERTGNPDFTVSEVIN